MEGEEKEEERIPLSLSLSLSLRGCHMISVDSLPLISSFFVCNCPSLMAFSPRSITRFAFEDSVCASPSLPPISAHSFPSPMQGRGERERERLDGARSDRLTSFPFGPVCINQHFCCSVGRLGMKLFGLLSVHSEMCTASFGCLSSSSSAPLEAGLPCSAVKSLKEPLGQNLLPEYEIRTGSAKQNEKKQTSHFYSLFPVVEN